MTLHNLYVDFAEARSQLYWLEAAFTASHPTILQNIDLPILDYSPDFWVEVWLSSEKRQDRNSKECLRMFDTAKAYIIARDFGEFDPERGAMLWKLLCP